jgi:arabinose-5-phosphate isomerase
MNTSEYKQIANMVFDREIDALKATKLKIGENFIRAIELIAASHGKIITMGIGKSGLVARKIAATLSSTGTSSIFIHPVECLHGDMGAISNNDVALVLSTSGESDEIRRIIVFLKNRNIPVVALTSNLSSYLAIHSDAAITIEVPNEACPMGLAPMASTTAQMATGDALAAVLMKINDFHPDDFAVLHPAGALGRKLNLRVSDLMHSGDSLPLVRTGTLMQEALDIMTAKAMGAILIVDKKSRLLGILTDGDLRRALQKNRNLVDLKVDEIMIKKPICVHDNERAYESLQLMENRPSQISILPVIDENDVVSGILRLHDLILAGLHP